MAGKTNAWENGLLLLLFNNTTYAGVGDGTGLVGSGTAGNLYVSLHTSDPGEAGSQTANEVGYTSYARVSVARSAGGWTVVNNEVTPVSAISFPECTGGTATATHFGIGTASAGAGILLYSGTITPNIAISSTVVPVLSTATKVTED